MSIPIHAAPRAKSLSLSRLAKIVTYVFLASVILLSPISAKALVLFDEAVQGDIENGSVSILGAGDFTISATTTRGFRGGPTDFDTLFISLAPGLEFTAGVLSITDIDNQTGGLAIPNIALSESTSSGFDTAQRFQFREDVLTFLVSNLPVSGDTFLLNPSGGCGGGCSGSYSYDWTYTLTASNIAPVPIGAPIWMLITACAGIIGLRFRQSV